MAPSTAVPLTGSAPVIISLSSWRLPSLPSLPFLPSTGTAWHVAATHAAARTPTRRTQPAEKVSFPKRRVLRPTRRPAHLRGPRVLLVQLVLHVLGDVRDGALVLVPDRLPHAAVSLGRAHFLALL